MTEEATPGSLYRQGRLEDAVIAANAAVRAAPGALAPRILLAELLLFAGNLERADRILDAAGDADPSAALVVAEFRQLLRAEMARRQWRLEGRVPEFIDEPTPCLQASVAARIAWRTGDAGSAARHAAEAEALRPRVAGRLDAVAFDDLRDACDLHIGYLEVLTTTGKYFWIPLERIESATFHPPLRPRDLFWRRATLAISGGPDGEVYSPALYGNDETREASLRLGRASDWIEQDGLVVGQGQRTWLVGDEASVMLSMASLEFAR
nr:type VI secretion system accessory protein TagJ [uncultured Lichenicoccus sp.]